MKRCATARSKPLGTLAVVGFVFTGARVVVDPAESEAVGGSRCMMGRPRVTCRACGQVLRSWGYDQPPLLAVRRTSAVKAFTCALPWPRGPGWPPPDAIDQPGQ